MVLYTLSMNEQTPEVRPRLEEVPEITPEKDEKLPIEVIEDILEKIRKEEEADDEEEPAPPTIH